MMTEIHVLNLGAGVQSTAVYLLMADGRLPRADYAIFADTQDEPGAVYDHLEWLKAQDGPEILVVTAGKLGDDLLSRDLKRVAAVPFFTEKNGDSSPTLRQCSTEYKVVPIERAIRRNILKLKPRQRLPRDVIVHEYFGISLDEAGRSVRIKKRVSESHKQFRAHFPLIESIPNGWTRADCRRYFEGRVPHEVPRSACVFCPYHNDREWIHIKNHDPKGWARAIEIDEGLRKPGIVVNRNMKASMYAHRTCKPLAEVEFKNERQLNMFTGECEGMCGN